MNSLQGILGLSSLRGIYAMLPFWHLRGQHNHSVYCLAFMRQSAEALRENLCLYVPLYSDRCEEADADEVSRHRCERPEEILSQIGLLQREMLVRLQTGGDLS